MKFREVYSESITFIGLKSPNTSLKHSEKRKLKLPVSTMHYRFTLAFLLLVFNRTSDIVEKDWVPCLCSELDIHIYISGVRTRVQKVKRQKMADINMQNSCDHSCYVFACDFISHCGTTQKN